MAVSTGPGLFRWPSTSADASGTYYGSVTRLRRCCATGIVEDAEDRGRRAGEYHVGCGADRPQMFSGVARLLGVLVGPAIDADNLAADHQPRGAAPVQRWDASNVDEPSASP